MSPRISGLVKDSEGRVGLDRAMAPLSSLSILVVDDSSTMRTILRNMLERLGARSIDEADSGRAALVRLRSTSYSLIISDLHMAPMNGLELLKEVRGTSRTGTNRFIFTTTERGWGTQTSAKIEGAQGYITKPFTIATLKAKIDGVLAAK